MSDTDAAAGTGPVVADRSVADRLASVPSEPCEASVGVESAPQSGVESRVESGVELIPVDIRRIPVALWSRTQEHIDELLREFTLIAAQLHDHSGTAEVPIRLIELVEELTQQFGSLNTDQENRLADAAQAGVPELDLVYHVPAHATEASRRLQVVLDEADAYCQQGEHLLTLASPPDLARFRRWFLDEFINQLAGAPPTPFPAYRG